MPGLSTGADTVLHVSEWCGWRSTMHLGQVHRWYKPARLAGVPVVVPPFRGSMTSWRTGQGGISTSIMIKWNPYICGGITPSTSTCWGPTGWKVVLPKRSLEWKLSRKWKTRWPWATNTPFMAKMGSSFLGYISKSIASRMRKRILFLFNISEATSRLLCPVLDCPVQKWYDLLEWVQCRED